MSAKVTKMELRRLLVLSLGICNAPFSLISAQTPVKHVQTGALKTVTVWEVFATVMLDTMETTAAKATAQVAHSITLWMVSVLLPVQVGITRTFTLKPARNA